MTREAEKQRDLERKESRTDKQLQTRYVEQAREAANDSNRAYGFRLREGR
jgi:hypothetical protein